MAFYWTSILNGQKGKQGEKHVSTLYIYNIPGWVGFKKFLPTWLFKNIYIYIEEFPPRAPSLPKIHRL